MTILIAGRPVKPGDKLYHKGFEAWGRVVRYDPSGSVELVIKGKSGERKLLVQQRGVVNGRRQVYWHKPIEVDLPYSDLSSVQRVVDVVAHELAREAE